MTDRSSHAMGAGAASLAAGGWASFGLSCRPGVGARRAFECVASRACCVGFPSVTPTPGQRARAVACAFPGFGLPMESGR